MITRHDIGTEYKDNVGVPALIEKPGGAYVLYEDHVAVLDELRAEKAGLESIVTAQAGTIAGLRDALPATLNDDLVAILGRPNFACAGIANILRKNGQNIPCRAENEQAATIHFLLKHYLDHGTAWAEKASEGLKAMAPATQQGGRS